MIGCGVENEQLDMRLVREIRAIEEAMGDGQAKVWPSEEAIKKKLQRRT